VFDLKVICPLDFLKPLWPLLKEALILNCHPAILIIQEFFTLFKTVLPIFSLFLSFFKSNPFPQDFLALHGEYRTKGRTPLQTLREWIKKPNREKGVERAA